MARSTDALRVAKGIRKVARAFLDAEGPAVANQALRMKEHGVGLSASLKDVSQELLADSISSVGWKSCLCGSGSLWRYRLHWAAGTELLYTTQVLGNCYDAVAGATLLSLAYWVECKHRPLTRMN